MSDDYPQTVTMTRTEAEYLRQQAYKKYCPSEIKNSHKTLCRYIGGSHLHGLNTPSSDIDIRGVFTNTDPSYILGTRNQEHILKQDAQDDISMYEIRRWIMLLRKANTEATDILFINKGFEEPADPIILECQWNWRKLFDPYTLYKSILGYACGELRLALGQRTGLLGAKRRTMVEKYGFSPKNFVQLFRLCHLARGLVRDGNYILDVRGTDYYAELIDIKTNPQNHSKAILEAKAREAIANLEALKIVAEKMDFAKYDEDFANYILLKNYRRFLCC